MQGDVLDISYGAVRKYRQIHTKYFIQARYEKQVLNERTIIIIIIILSCLTSLDFSKPIQKRISVNHEGLSTPITT